MAGTCKVSLPKGLRMYVHQIKAAKCIYVSLASSNECFLSVAYIIASSSVYIDGVVAARPARPIVCVVTSSLPIAITNGIAIIK